MKLFILFFYLIILFEGFSQTYFEMEGERKRVGIELTKYIFEYTVKDTLELKLVDSVKVYTSSDRRTEKEVKTNLYFEEDIEPVTYYVYLDSNYLQTEVRTFKEGRLLNSSKWKYDRFKRIKYLVYMNQNGELEKRHYKYKDSLINSGRIEVQSIYSGDSILPKYFIGQVLNEYDKDEQLIRIMEVGKNLNLIRSYTVVYDHKDSIVNYLPEGYPIIDTSFNAECEFRIEYEFNSSELRQVEKLIHKTFYEMDSVSLNDDCENFQIELFHSNLASLKIIQKKLSFINPFRIYFTRKKYYN